MQNLTAFYPKTGQFTRPRFSGGLEELAGKGAAKAISIVTGGAVNLTTDVLADKVAGQFSESMYPDIQHLAELDSYTLCRAGGRLLAPWVSSWNPQAKSVQVAKCLKDSIDLIKREHPKLLPQEKAALEIVSSKIFVSLFMDSHPFAFYGAEKVKQVLGAEATPLLFSATWRLFHAIEKVSAKGLKPDQVAITRQAFFRQYFQRFDPGTPMSTCATLLAFHVQGEHDLAAKPAEVKRWLKHHNGKQAESRQFVRMVPKTAGWIATILGGPEAWAAMAGGSLLKRVIGWGKSKGAQTDTNRPPVAPSASKCPK